MTVRTAAPGVDGTKLGAGEPDAPAATVIIPTHDRCALLERALDCLCRQTVDMAAIEVIVVADGCTDGTLEMLHSGRRPFQLRVLLYQQRGSAASRNAAAAVARGRVLIFLDDDIMAAPDLVERHLACHEDGRPSAAIGRLAPAPLAGVPACWRWLESQLEKQYQAMLEGRRRIGGMCLYSGNCSITRESFLEAGGFDEALCHAEDIDLGLRLEQAGVTFRLALGASGEHWGYRDYGAWREMGYRYGRWDAVLSLNPDYPLGLARLREEFGRRGRPARLCVTLTCSGTIRLRLLTGVLRALAALSGALSLTRLQRSAYAGIYGLTYWSGVSDELGGLRTVAAGEGRTR